MQRLFFIIISLFFLLFSCAKERPKGILPESEMTELLTEVSLIDAYLNTLPIDSGRKVMTVLYSNLFKQFDIDSLQYVRNLDFYYGNPKLTEEIYKTIDLKLKEYDQSLRVEDSIRSVFVNDSIRRVSRIYELDGERRNNTLNYYRDTSYYGFKEASLSFYQKMNVHLNAYGVQVSAVPSASSAMPIIEPLLQDSLLNKYLQVPIYKLLKNKPIDTTTVDFRFLNIYFLNKAGLTVRTGYSNMSSVNALIDNLIVQDSLMSVDSLSQIDSVLPSDLSIPKKPNLSNKQLLKPMPQ